MEILSPDGEIGSPLQAIGLLLVTLAGGLILLRGLAAQARDTGLGGLVTSLWRYDSAVALALVALALLNLVNQFTPLTGVFRPEVGDGGLIENLTITVMIFPAVIFLAHLLSGKPRRGHFGPSMMTALSLALLAGFGEEISWGQHWFGLAVPDAIAQANLQSEINLHNYIPPGMMEAIYFATGLVLLLIAANLRQILKSTEQVRGLLALRALLVLSAVLLCHHVFQELGELAVIIAGFLIWKRLDDGRLSLKPRWLKTLTAY
ncbi:hypothetical protein [Maricaulis salignorans]|uniref:Uncharacterized protein n=1 Tax=Maricaulis salignorans TaxID=144026 RepID=A0A1G9T983_9PROT|nr:hypothetical protein [Maricaulis salignorans]SDM44303.1 hypothetical protein SAMN04488568_11182 [Maricaulis salignorans]